MPGDSLPALECWMPWLRTLVVSLGAPFPLLPPRHTPGSRPLRGYGLGSVSLVYFYLAKQETGAPRTP